MLGISALNIIDDWIVNPIMKLLCGIWFMIIKAIAWVLDMLTQLFFIFAGMTPIGTNTINTKTGVDEGIDIVNYFLTQKSFQRAYLYLCLVALGLIVVFTIAKIIKQDYFDRAGPRSKGPIFRNVALSFIAFICVIPIFYFMIDVVGSLSLLVMKAMGYKGGGLGSMLFNLSWEDNGAGFRAVGEAISNDMPDPDNFGWYHGDTFYEYFWNERTGERFATGAINSRYQIGEENIKISTFYWWMFVFTGLILIVNLAKMLTTMVSRLYKLIALFIVAPAPISQIVLDEGQKFKIWKDNVLKEALKVVSCVMSFMIFMLIAGAVPNIDLMKFAYTDQAATAYNLLESNSLTSELSYGIDALYYSGDVPGGFDKVINALGRCMILIAGVGAIQDMDSVVAPVLGSGSAFDSGNTGKAIVGAAGAAGKFALDSAKKLTGAAVNMASTALVGGAVGAEKGIMQTIEGFGGKKDDGTGETPETPKTPEMKRAEEIATAKQNASNQWSSAFNAKSRAEEKMDDAKKRLEAIKNDPAKAEEREKIEDEIKGYQDSIDRQDKKMEEASKERQELEKEDAELREAHPELNAEGGSPSTEDTSAGGGKPETAGAPTSGGTSGGAIKPLNTLGNNANPKKLSALGKIGKGAAGVLGTASGIIRRGVLPAAWTGVKTGASTMGMLAKTVAKMTGMGAIADGVEDLGRGMIKETKEGLKKGAGRFLQPKKDKNGNIMKDANGNPIYNSNVAKALVATGGALKTAKDWVAEEGLVGGVLARGLSTASNAAVKPEEKLTKEESAALGSTQQSIQTSVNTANQIVDGGGDVSVASQDVVNGADRLVSEATSVNDTSYNVTGQRDSQLQVTDPATRATQKQEVKKASDRLTAAEASHSGAESHIKRVAEVKKTNEERRTEEAQSAADWKNVVERFEVDRTDLMKPQSGKKLNILQRYACKRGIAAMAKKYKTALTTGDMDESQYNQSMAELDDAYLRISETGQIDGIDENLMEEIRASDGYKEVTKAKGTHSPEGCRKLMGSQHNVEANYEAGMEARATANEKKAGKEYDKAQENLVKAQEENKGTLMDQLVDAREEYTAASDEYAEAQRTYTAAQQQYQDDPENENLTTAREGLGAAAKRVARAGENLTSASQNVTTRMSDVYARTKKTSAQNTSLNEGYTRVNTSVTRMDEGIKRMRANGASQTEIQAAEQQRDEIVATTRAARGKREKVKVKVAKTAEKQINAQANAAENMNAQKRRMGMSGKTKPTASTPSYLDVEIVEDYSVNELKNMTREGSIGGSLAAAYHWGAEYHAGRSDLETFVDCTNGLANTAEVQLSNADLERIIKEIDFKKAGDAIADSKFGTVSEYKTDLRERYKATCSNYSQCIDEAKRAVAEYNAGGGKNPESLQRAQRAIAAAVQHSTNLRDIQVEIEGLKK